MCLHYCVVQIPPKNAREYMMYPLNFNLKIIFRYCQDQNFVHDQIRIYRIFGVDPLPNYNSLTEHISTDSWIVDV